MAFDVHRWIFAKAKVATCSKHLKEYFGGKVVELKDLHTTLKTNIVGLMFFVLFCNVYRVLV